MVCVIHIIYNNLLRVFFVNDSKYVSIAERAITTLKIIGPPVFNGGFSTFLAFILLASSKAYLFSAFFKVRFNAYIY